MEDGTGGGGRIQASKSDGMMQHQHVIDKVCTLNPCAIAPAESHKVKH